VFVGSNTVSDINIVLVAPETNESMTTVSEQYVLCSEQTFGPLVAFFPLPQRGSPEGSWASSNSKIVDRKQQVVHGRPAGAVFTTAQMCCPRSARGTTTYNATYHTATRSQDHCLISLINTCCGLIAMFDLVQVYCMTNLCASCSGSTWRLQASRLSF
jgi:hypothetical protein